MSTPNGTQPQNPPQTSQALTPYQERSIALREGIGQDTAPRAIVPRTFAEAQSFAGALASSSLVPEKLRERAPDILMIVLAGAEHGIAPIRALTLFHVVEGVPKLSADGISAIVTAHPLCEYLEPIEQSDERVTWAAKKHGRPELRLTWDKEAATRAGLWGKRNWAGYPRQMLNARCKAEICRLVFPEVTAGLISAEEARDIVQDTQTGGVPAGLAAPPAPSSSSLPRDTAKQGDGTPAGGKGKASKPPAAKPPIDVPSTPSSSSPAPASSSPPSDTHSSSRPSAGGSTDDPFGRVRDEMSSSATPSQPQTPTASSTATSSGSSSSTAPAPSATTAPDVTASSSATAPPLSSASEADDVDGFGGSDDGPIGKTIEGFRAALAEATKDTLEAVKAEWVPWTLKGQPGHAHAGEMRSLFAKRRTELSK